MTLTYSHTTDKIKVTVTPIYLNDQSVPEANYYAWAYQVKLENFGTDIVQLISRHWKITDANGFTKEVKGPGVIGEQPVLKPGEVYEYTSGTLLPTPSGIMFGSYQMVSDRGRFDITIPAFSLDTPDYPATVH